LILTILLPINETAQAVPALPVLHILKQSDGTTFKARQWGDERMHGWETIEGHTIVFDTAINSWTYAVKDRKGALKSSGLKVVPGNPPSALRKHIRPSGQILSKVPSKALKSEKTSVDVLQKNVPSTGTANIPVILINFSDTSTTYSKSSFDTLLFGSGNFSMKDYYEEVSYGVLSVSAGPGGISGWHRASNTHNYYGQNNSRDMWPGTLVREAVAAADAAGFNFAPYDQNGDCYVDIVVIIHQGDGEEASGDSTDIWSHHWSLNDAYYWGYSNGGEYTTNDDCTSNPSVKVKVDDYTIQPETLWGGQVTMGVFAHEYGHALGLPDLYDTDGSSEGIGNWSLMAGGVWNYITKPGDRPAHPDAWSKYFLGWVNPTIVTGTLSNEPIEQAESSADVYKLLSGTSLSGEYFLVENRQQVGFDAGLPGSGLLIWHIDGDKIASTINSNRVNNSECYPGNTSCASDHYGVRLVQADNNWDLEKKLNSGDDGDPFPGSSDNTSFTDISMPSSNFYNGTPSGASITYISDSAAIMTATLEMVRYYSLRVTESGNGSGNIMSSPSGIDCGSSCSASFVDGTQVTLTATPGNGSVFLKWFYDCSPCGGNTTCEIIMTKDKICTAMFKDPSKAGSQPWIPLLLLDER